MYLVILWKLEKTMTPKQMQPRYPQVQVYEKFSTQKFKKLKTLLNLEINKEFP